LLRTAVGGGASQRDLDVIVAAMRQRLLAGKTNQPPKLPRLSPQFLRKRLDALQLRKLRRTVDYVTEHLPFYQRTLGSAGISRDSIRSLADLRKLPFTERHHIESQASDFISRAPGMMASVILPSTGTSGRALDVFLTSQEFERFTSLQAIAGMVYNFLGPAHIVQVHLPADVSIAAKILTQAANKSGALTLPMGFVGDLDKSLDSLLEKRNVPGKFPQVSALFAAPGYLWALASRSLQRGLQSSDFGLKNISSGGAKVSRELRALVSKAWGVTLREGYSMAEMVSTGAYSCDVGNLHFLEYSGILEVLDPLTREPVKFGDVGVAVFTALYPDRELMPILRYWTRDLVRLIACPCGQITVAIEEVVGRTDHMVIVGGQNFYPQPIGDVLTAFAELVQPPRFHIHNEERTTMQHTVLEIECAAPLTEAARAQLLKKIQAALPFNHAVHIQLGVVQYEIHLVPPNSIAVPFRYKLQGPTPV